MKLGTTAHPKFRRLMIKLDLRQYEAAGLLELLWAMAAQFTDDGNLSRFDCDDIAAYLDWRGDPKTLVDTLVDCRWIDRDGDSLSIHDWADHMPHFITERIRKREDRAKKLKDKTKTESELSQDCPGTILESCTESDLAQPSLAQPSAAQASRVNNSAAAKAADDDSFFDGFDAEKTREDATKIRKLMPSLDRDYVWRSVAIGNTLSPGIIDDLVARLREGAVKKPKAYIDKILRDESVKAGRDLSRLMDHAPPTPPPTPPPSTPLIPPRRPKPAGAKQDIRVMDDPGLRNGAIAS
jgi:hypothetical protein